jgi:methionyl aminopeptidase
MSPHFIGIRAPVPSGPCPLTSLHFTPSSPPPFRRSLASPQVSKLFTARFPAPTAAPGGVFPRGEELEHAGDFNTSRTTSEEKRHLERLHSDLAETLREAAEVHRQVRAHANSIIRPGIKLAEMCESIENMNRKLVGESGLARGIAFPTGCSLNHVAAH